MYVTVLPVSDYQSLLLGDSRKKVKVKAGQNFSGMSPKIEKIPNTPRKSRKVRSMNIYSPIFPTITQIRVITKSKKAYKN